MKILIDANPVYTNQLTGIGYFTDELIKHIEKYCDVEGFAFNFMGKKKYKKDIYVQVFVHWNFVYFFTGVLIFLTFKYIKHYPEH